VIPEENLRVLVLLAAYNGMEFLDQQLASILAQQGVSVHVLVSVDRGDDGTEQHVAALSMRDERVSHLPFGERFGSAAPNFFRLLLDADYHSYSHVALADQDDVWLPDKLRRAVELLEKQQADAYSSSVWTWDGAERMRLLNKAQPQRRWDHLFSSAGPGCSYVFTAELTREFSAWLARDPGRVAMIEYHDWLLYAWVRETGHAWWIDPTPGMLYRQHPRNQLGANVGWRAAARRFTSVRANWYGQQVLEVSRCVGAVGSPPVQLVGRSDLICRLRLAAMAPQLRRARRDAIALIALTLLGRPHEGAGG
jgi:rhamnosyltransferase